MLMIYLSISVLFLRGIISCVCLSQFDYYTKCLHFSVIYYGKVYFAARTGWEILLRHNNENNSDSRA